MQFIEDQLRRGTLTAAAALPQLTNGGAAKLRPPKIHLRLRPNKMLAIYNGGDYQMSTGTRDPEEADRVLNLFRLQDEAKRAGIIDARNVQLSTISQFYLDQLSPERRTAIRTAKCRMKQLAPYIQGLRLGELTGDRVVAIEKELRKRYAVHTICCMFKTLRAAIRAFCVQHGTPLVLPFPPRPRPRGRDRVLTAEEQARILRWCKGSEVFDPVDGTWRPVKVDKFDRHRRIMIERLLKLGLATGSRGCQLEGLAWAPNRQFGHIDLGTGTLHRLPIGSSVNSRKKAPAVTLPPALLKEIRSWRETDGSQRYVLRTWTGRPIGQKFGKKFSAALQGLGIHGVTRHTLRHTMITNMIEAGVPAAVISATAGISVEVLRDVYNHSDEAAVQPLAHQAIERLLRRD